MTKAGISHLVETTAEYMGNIPLDLQAEFPDVPWRAMADMRDRVAHSYHELDVEIVDSTVEMDLPKLVEQIDNMLEVIH